MNAHAKDLALATAILDRIDPHRERLSTFDVAPHARTLRRAQLTLHRWAELECGDGHAYIERDEATGRPRIYRERRFLAPNDPRCWSPIPDRERGALARVAAVCKAAGLHYYHQTDPRGCALYVAAEPLTDQNYSSKGVPCL